MNSAKCATAVSHAVTGSARSSRTGTKSTGRCGRSPSRTATAWSMLRRGMIRTRFTLSWLQRIPSFWSGPATLSGEESSLPFRVTAPSPASGTWML